LQLSVIACTRVQERSKCGAPSRVRLWVILVLEAKKEKGLTFEAIVNKIGKPKVWTAAALFVTYEGKFLPYQG
jgi:hypothetical protein